MTTQPLRDDQPTHSIKPSAMDPNIEKLADALGWKRHIRNNVEVWYDPEGGHVVPHELPDALNCAIDQLIAEAGEPLPEDLAALAKLGNPFRSDNEKPAPR